MSSKKLTALALALAMAAVATFVVAQDVAIVTDPALAGLSPDQMVAKRQALMKEDGGLLKGAGGLSGSEAAAVADKLITNFSNLTVLFPEGSAVGDSGALPAVWEKNAEFQAILVKAVATATQMKAAAEAGDAATYAASIKTIGGFCGECHQTFRKQNS